MYLYESLQHLLRYLIETNNLGYIVVDESYCENQWMSGQKQNYHALGLLRCICNHIPWVVATIKTNIEVNMKRITKDFNNLK